MIRLISRNVTKRFKHRYHPFRDAKNVQSLSDSHQAIRNRTTVYPSTIIHARDVPRLLIDGRNNYKTGDRVVKGPWEGGKIFTLTLPERMTCPRHCNHWLDCYGNAMPFSRRILPSVDLVTRLDQELWHHTHKYKRVVVRLHVLGDFFSVEYVKSWTKFLALYENLHVFGYTAWRQTDQIGIEIALMMRKYPDRAVIRWSSPLPQPLGSITVTELPPARARNLTQQTRPIFPTSASDLLDRVLPISSDIPSDDRVPSRRGVKITVCPAQTGATDCCGTCALCWSPSYKHGCIAFIRHGRWTKEKTA